jgi:ATP-binding cassette subfamily B protein
MTEGLPSASVWSLLRRLAIDRRAIARAVALQMLQSLSYLPLSAGVAWLVDHVLRSPDVRSLSDAAPLLVGYLAANVALYLVHARLTLSAFVASETLTRAAIARLRADVVERLFALRLSFVERRGAGALAHQLTSDVERVEGFLALAAARLVPAVTLGALALLYLALREPWLALVTAVAVPLSVALSLRARARLDVLASRARASGESFAASIVETALGLRHLRSLGADPSARRALEERIEALRAAGLETGVAVTRAALALQMVHDLLPVVIWCVGGALFLSGKVSLGSLVAFVALLVFVQGALTALTDAHRGWITALPAWRTIETLLGASEPEADAVEGDLALDGSLALEHVTLAHTTSEGEARVALDDVCLQIGKGERVAIVGPSGAGKSSLLDLVAGLVEPTRGEIRWSGRGRTEIGRASLRRAIAVAPQDPFLFRTTVRENVRMGRPEASDADVERACARAGLTPLLLKLPQGLDTAIDERGLNLSGGERQRIGLARLFVRDPKILVLDEPTSALDAETERKILPELEALFEGRTVLVATHRPLLAERADRVLVIVDGRIVEDAAPSGVAFLRGAAHRSSRS